MGQFFCFFVCTGGSNFFACGSELFVLDFIVECYKSLITSLTSVTAVDGTCDELMIIQVL